MKPLLALAQCDDEIESWKHSRVVADFEQAPCGPHCPTDAPICILR